MMFHCNAQKYIFVWFISQCLLVCCNNLVDLQFETLFGKSQRTQIKDGEERWY